MEYAECQKAHDHLGGKADGCLQYKSSGLYSNESCHICNCGSKYHRKVDPKTRVVYTKCHKIHDFNSQSLDGCQEFSPAGKIGTLEALTCDACGCHRGFHRNDITTHA